jgi:CRISPR-associated protein Cas2
MRGVADYAVAYDISDDGERERVEKTLKDFGFRIQKSVFECRLTRSRLQLLLTRLRSLNLQTGFVKVYCSVAMIPSRTTDTLSSKPTTHTKRAQPQKNCGASCTPHPSPTPHDAPNATPDYAHHPQTCA